jgi:hypothetical protein
MQTRILLVAVSLSLASCASTGPNVFNRPPASMPVEVPCLPALDSLAKLPPYLVPAPAGSSARQRRQWQKAQATNLARAGVLPAKVKNSSVATGAGSVATTVTKPHAPVATGAGSAMDNAKAGQRGGGVALGAGAHTEASTEGGMSYWWLLLVVIGVVWCLRKRVALLFGQP